MKTKTICNMLLVSMFATGGPTYIHAQSSVDTYRATCCFREMHASGCRTGTFFGAAFENRHLTKELMMEEVWGNIALGDNILPFYVSHYGNGAYGQLHLACGYGRNFGGRFSLSVRFFYLLEHARHYPSRHSIFVDASFDCMINRKLHLAASISNPFNMRYGITASEHIPIRFNVAASYKISGRIVADIMLSKAFPGGFEAGGRLFYSPVAGLILDLACTNARLDFGICVPLKRFLLTVRSCWSYRLSLSPQLQLMYFPPSKTAES